MSKEIELKHPNQCVRCGHTMPNIVEYKNIFGDTYYFVECVVCKARTKGYATEAMAKTMWQNGEVSEGI